jgi:hypothetical protein
MGPCSKLFIALGILFLAIGAGFCADDLGSQIGRPWQYSAWNEYTFTFFDVQIVNPDITDATLAGMIQKSLDRGNMDAKALGLANSYEASLASAVKDRVKCGVFFRFDEDNNVNVDTVIMGNARGSMDSESDAKFLHNNPDCAELLGMRGVEETYEEDNETKTRYYITDVSEAKLSFSASSIAAFSKLITYTHTNDYTNTEESSSAGQILILAVQKGLFNLDQALRDELYLISLLDSAHACIDYNKGFLNTTEYLLQDYDYSANMSRSNMTRVGNIYKDLEFKGFCNRNYTGIGSQLCRQLESEVYSNGTDYFTRANEEDAKLRRSISIMPANLTFAISGMNYMWAFIASNAGVEDEYRQKNDSFFKLLHDEEQKADSNKEALDKETAKLKAENLDEITEIYVPEGSLSTSIGAISASEARYEEESRNATQELARLKQLGVDKDRGWAVEQYQGYIALNARMSEATVSARETLYYAKATVNYTRSQAISIAGQKAAQGYNVSFIYAQVNLGDAEKTLGNQFKYYKEAYLFALSLSAPNPTQNQTETLAALKAEVSSMLTKAKADGIDVSSEQAKFDLYKNDANLILAIEQMNGIKDSIIQKAQASFSDLQYTRERLVRYFEADRQGVLDDVRNELAGYEAGLISGSSIDYGAALGKLTALRAHYAEIEKKIEDALGTYLSSAMVPEVEYAPPVVEMNEMSSVSGTIIIENPLSETVDNVNIRFTPPLPLEPSEISGISAKKSGTDIVFTIPRLEPLEIKTYEFRKQGIFAKGTLMSTRTEGDGGTAYITETWLVEVLIPLDGLVMGSYDSVAFNGVGYPSGTVTKPIAIGTYEATAEKSKEDAYNMSERQSTSENSQATIIQRAIHVIPAMYFDTIMLRKEAACSVNSSSYAYTQSQQQVILQKVRNEGDVVLTCTYSKDTVHETIDDLFDDITGSNLSAQEQQRLDNITIMLNLGQNSTALSELLLLNRTVAMRLDAERKANTTLAKDLLLLDGEIASLNESVVLAGSLGHSSYLIELYSERLASLLSLRARVMATTAANATALLSSYSPQWSETETSKWLSQAFTNFTKLEKIYNDNGMDDPSVSENMALFRQSYVKAKGAESNFTQAVYSSYYLGKVSDSIYAAIATKASGLALLNASLEASLSALEADLTVYEAIYNDAKQHDLESYLPYSPSYFSSEIAKMRKATTERQMRQFINQSASLSAIVSGAINSIAGIAENELSSARLLFEQYKSRLDSGTASGMAGSLDEANGYIGAQKYGSAINAAKEVSESIGELISQSDEGNMRLLAIGLLIVGSLVVILYSYREAIMGHFGKRKHKVELRKLKKGGDEGQE